MIYRVVIATMWRGPLRVAGRLAEADVIEAWDDAEITRYLSKLRVDPIPDTEEERRERLLAWPNADDLNAIASSLTARNGGVRPTVRVLEEARMPGRSLGAAGSVRR